jgi:hypothetical protein
MCSHGPDRSIRFVIDKHFPRRAKSSGLIFPSPEGLSTGIIMRIALLTLTSVAVIGSGTSASAQTPTADDIIAHYIKTIGGADKIQSIRTLRRIGKFTGDDGFEAGVVQESSRPNRIRKEFSIQGMTRIKAYDGANGWMIDPFGGKKDPESLSEEEMRSIVEESDFDEPLINYRQKGNRVEFAGTDQVEGTEVYKLRVTLKSADTRTYYMDTDSYVPIKVETKQIIRGTPQETETTLGDYKQVGGWFLPFSMEGREKGSSWSWKITLDKIEFNVPIDSTRYFRPKPPASGGSR